MPCVYPKSRDLRYLTSRGLALALNPSTVKDTLRHPFHYRGFNYITFLDLICGSKPTHMIGAKALVDENVFLEGGYGRQMPPETLAIFLSVMSC